LLESFLKGCTFFITHFTFLSIELYKRGDEKTYNVDAVAAEVGERQGVKKVPKSVTYYFDVLF